MRTPPDLYLAIDQGGHASRALIFDRQGHCVAQAESGVETQHPQPGWVEHDPEAMVASIKACINSARLTLGQKSANIVAAGLATQRSSIVCWDRKTGAALSPIISWQDCRHAKWLTSLQLNTEEIHTLTGLQPSPHYGASKLRWCLDHLPAVQLALKEARLRCGPMASFLLFHLLSEQPDIVDPVNASRTLLWNLAHHHWDQRLLDLFGIPIETLPHCASNQHQTFGHIKIGQQQIPLTLLTGDQPAALFAWGRPQAQHAYINIGTGAFIQRPLKEITDTAPRLLTGIAYSDQHEKLYTLEGSVNGAATALEWFKQHYHIEQIEKKLPRWLAESDTPPLFINGISGLGSPWWRSNIESHFIGAGTTAEKCVAVIESIVFMIHSNLQEMAKSTTPPKTLFVSGGMANIDGLCQRLADLTTTELRRPTECEATARGVAYLIAQHPTHWIIDSTATAFIPTPNRGLNARYLAWQQQLHKTIA